MQQTRQQPLFSLDQLVATPGALAALEKAGQGPLDFLSRHVHGDWGDLCEEDRRENQFSLEQGFRLLSSYRILAGVKLYVITEADRSVTTILLPEEY
jgi:invasion protein IalB